MRYRLGGVVGGLRLAGGVRLELVEQAVEVAHVEDDAAPLGDADQARAPLLVEGAALDADVGHGLGVVQASARGCAGDHRALHGISGASFGTLCLPRAMGCLG